MSLQGDTFVSTCRDLHLYSLIQSSQQVETLNIRLSISQKTSSN
ncbi:hypothetical protein GCWU000325_02706 [Alloprevotella tannerae ATCC 51259]|uniref:Uncharacterized protein n=1 Tax=Alloprevotella tannerae ATCC 51259 TaxID=626522 RepID=C9LKE1_9BACT|nr:hypothetical protein GCWU000325_02706 [Alloprevotella tannerae ATCC 51259]